MEGGGNNNYFGTYCLPVVLAGRQRDGAPPWISLVDVGGVALRILRLRALFGTVPSVFGSVGVVVLLRRPRDAPPPRHSVVDVGGVALDQVAVPRAPIRKEQRFGDRRSQSWSSLVGDVQRVRTEARTEATSRPSTTHLRWRHPHASQRRLVKQRAVLPEARIGLHNPPATSQLWRSVSTGPAGPSSISAGLYRAPILRADRRMEGGRVGVSLEVGWCLSVPLNLSTIGQVGFVPAPPHEVVTGKT